MTLGEKIKLLRINHGMTQEALSEYLNVSRSTIAKWETNGGMPDISNLKALAEVLDVSIDDLLNDTKGIKDKINEAEHPSSLVNDGHYYDIDLEGWNTGIFHALIVGEDNDFLFYQIEGKKENKYGFITKQYITNVHMLEKSSDFQSNGMKIDRTYFHHKHVMIECAYKKGILKGFFDFHNDDYLDVVIHSFSESKLYLELGREIEIGIITKVETI